MSEPLTLNWGIVSTGRIANDFCIALRSLPPESQQFHVLQAVAARSLEDAEDFARHHKIATAYQSYDSIFEDGQVNIVYIATLNNTHQELSLKALEAGKHVLCEKPMALNAAEQEEVFEKAKSKGLFFMEGLWTRFFPAIERLRKELDEKTTLGEVKFFTSSFLRNFAQENRACRKDLGGGAILNLGIYPIQLACLVFGHEKPQKITCSGHLMSSGVDECCTITLLYSNNRLASLNMACNCADFGASAIVGDKGSIVIPENSRCPTRLRLNNKEELAFDLPEPCESTYYANCVGFCYQVEAVREAIAQGRREHPLATHDNSRLILSIMDEARRQLGYDNTK